MNRQSCPDHNVPDTQHTSPPNPPNGLYAWLVLASVMLATFMAVLDATIVNVALPKLLGIFGVSIDTAEWILTAYMLVFGVILPLSGWLADRWGYKRIFLLGLALFTFGSLLSSLAWGIHVLIAFRVVQGAGGGVIMPVGMAIITREFPPEKRGIALGFWGVAASASVSLGPTLGGYLIDHFAWHTIFDVNIPVGLLALVAGSMILREYRSDEVHAFDVIGFLSLSVSLTALLLALASGNANWNTGGWTSPFILTCFAVAGLGSVVFLTAELNVVHPLMKLELFTGLNFTASNIVLLIFALGMFGSNFLLPLYLQNVLNYTPFQAGLVFLPVGIVLGMTSPLAGMFADKYNAKLPVIIGLALLALTLYQFSFLSAFSERFAIVLPLYLRGIAMGLLFSPLTALALSEIPSQDMAQTSSLINVVRQIGGSFGVAIFGTILTRRTFFHTAMYGQQVNPFSDAVQATLSTLRYFVLHTTGGTLSVSLDEARSLLIGFMQKQAFVQAIDNVFFLAALTLLLSILPALFLRAPLKTPGRWTYRGEP